MYFKIKVKGLNLSEGEDFFIIEKDSKEEAEKSIKGVDFSIQNSEDSNYCWMTIKGKEIYTTFHIHRAVKNSELKNVSFKCSGVIKGISKKLTKIINDADFDIHVSNNNDSLCYELERYTPMGEDWILTIFANNDEEFIDNLDEYNDNYDPEEEASIWIDSRGKNGVPDSIRDLLDDADWKGEEINKLYQKVRKA